MPDDQMSYGYGYGNTSYSYPSYGYGKVIKFANIQPE
jgi:hypothetical protein